MQPETESNFQSSKLWKKTILNITIFVILLIPLIVCEFIIEPYSRGFFCNDETIKYPFRSNTVTPTVLGVIIGLPPLLIIISSEYIRLHYKGNANDMRSLWGLIVPLWLINCLKQLVYFSFGLLLTIDATEIGKYTIGRIRPHFIAICQPQLRDGSSCSNATNQHRYIENYYCARTGYSADDVRQARLSFPSGHASLAFYALLYMVIYLQNRVVWQKGQLIKPFIQFTLLTSAWFIALTRIMDNWHHWSDVMAGSILGTLGALLTAGYISKVFKPPPLVLNSLPRQDTSATLNEVLAGTPPPYTMDQKIKPFAEHEYSSKDFRYKS
uniref:Phosphatidic acid phosphatase type 2/haloperoxidase domain-containing protein n=1 Tax=Glossina brevipalpis TaxID=37001 RepID=A0A1A9WD98_9MUSC